MDPDLRRDDVERGHAARYNFNFIPAVMAKPCFAWTAGTYASLRAGDARGLHNAQQRAEVGS